MTTIATVNLKHTMSKFAMLRDLRKVIGRGPDIIGLQEIDRARAKAMRGALAHLGYGLVIQNGVPIAYRVDKYKLAASGSKLLSGHTHLSQAGNGSANPVKHYANYVALVDRKSGEKSVLTNTHLLASNYLPGRKGLYRQQVRRLADYQRDLEKRFGKKANYFLTGDMNTSKRGKLGNQPLNLYRAPEKTQAHGYIDWIGSTLDRGQAEVMNLRSDHDAYLMTFGKDSDGVTGNGGNGGGGGGHNGHGGGGHNGHNGGGGNGGGGGGTTDQGMTAFDYFSALLETWGIPVGNDIEKIIRQAVKDGITPDNIGLIIPDIQNTESWATRFPAWKDRPTGMTVDQYFLAENAYRDALHDYGMPSGFYDSYSDLGNFIANSVSEDELRTRLSDADTLVKSVDPTVRNLMAQFYGLSTGDVAAYFLDPKRADQIIKQQYETANVAGWAQRAGFGIDDMTRYEELYRKGVTVDQAASQYGTIKSLADTVGGIAGVYGDKYDQSDAENDVFFGQSEKRRKLVSQESATFSGSSRGSTGSASRQSY